MIEDKKNEDVFLQLIGSVKPLKKSNKNFKKLKLSKIKTTKEYKTAGKLNAITLTNDTKPKNERDPLKIESSLIKKKLKKGKILIDKKVDFHGLSIEEAKKKFVITIDECFYSSERCILFVTGKGMKETNYDKTNIRLFHGKIRENFQKWIYEKDVVSKILNFTPAGYSHGGDGAFFVYLRKNKN